jgi:hypothetical protein
MSNFILGLDPSKAYTSQDFKLGLEGADDDGKVFRFVQANGALTVGQVVGIDASGQATPLTTTTSAPGAGQGQAVGVVVTALADNQYGWVQRYGAVSAISVGTACAIYTEVNSTATAGRVDDDATAGSEAISGLVTSAAEASNAAAGVLNYPYVGRTK